MAASTRRSFLGYVEMSSPQGYGKVKTREDFIAAARHAKSLPEGNGRLGVVGFRYGGGIANFLATRLPDLDAAMPFYGAAPALEDVPKIKAALQLHFAGNDPRINAGWPAYEHALEAGLRPNTPST
jgi:carboxymethylenebutenolidase